MRRGLLGFHGLFFFVMAISCGFDSSGTGDEGEGAGSAGSGDGSGTSSGGGDSSGGETSGTGGGGTTGGGTDDTGGTGDGGGGTTTGTGETTTGGGTSSGGTSTGGTSSGGTSSGGTSTGGTSTGGTSTGGTSTGGTSSGGTSSGGTSTGGTSTGGTSSGGVCDPGEFVKEIELVEDAVVEEPMQTAQSNLGEGLYAFSEVENEGTVTFSVLIPCEDDYVVWGRVVDSDPGTGQNDPDSFYVSVDGGTEITWFYGCQTFGNNEVWSWEQVQANELGQQCDQAVDLVVTLDAGVHTVRMRNREPQSGGDFAGIARILVTNDQAYVPSDGE